MAIEIVDFPINSMVIFHCYVSSPEGNGGQNNFINHPQVNQFIGGICLPCHASGWLMIEIYHISKKMNIQRADGKRRGSRGSML